MYEGSNAARHALCRFQSGPSSRTNRYALNEANVRHHAGAQRAAQLNSEYYDAYG